MLPPGWASKASMLAREFHTLTRPLIWMTRSTFRRSFAELFVGTREEFHLERAFVILHFHDGPGAPGLVLALLHFGDEVRASRRRGSPRPADPRRCTRSDRSSCCRNCRSRCGTYRGGARGGKIREIPSRSRRASSASQSGTLGMWMLSRLAPLLGLVEDPSKSDDCALDFSACTRWAVSISSGRIWRSAARHGWRRSKAPTLMRASTMRLFIASAGTRRTKSGKLLNRPLASRSRMIA